MQNPLEGDLNHVLAHTEGLWDELRGERIFITGGTGFFGCWLLETFLWANERLKLNASATVLTRRPDAFRHKAPHLAGSDAVHLLEGDVRTFRFPSGRFSHVIHAATESSTNLNARDPLGMFDTIVDGTRHTLDFACASGAARFLLTSSGAVYGVQPNSLAGVPEDYISGPDPNDLRSAYAEGKRAAELMCAIYAGDHGLHTTIARGFAFVGPYFPLNAHFAIGNFIRDALEGGPIRVNGGGSPFRSYLYAADLAIWLWTILIRGSIARPYNVGSGVAVSIEQLAHIVADMSGPSMRVAVSQQTVDAHRDRYVPAVARAACELGLHPIISLPDAVQRTIGWHIRQRGAVHLAD